MNKFTKISATALLALFLTACDKPADKAPEAKPKAAQTQAASEVKVDEKHIGSVKVGQAVEVSSSVYPDEKYSGVVTFVAPKADASLNFPVEVEIKNNTNNTLKAGMYGTAYFGEKENSQVLTVPRTAFVGSVSSNQVYVIKNGKAELKTISSGRNFGDYIEVLSGLSKGDQVVTTGQVNLSDQTPVEIIK